MAYRVLARFDQAGVRVFHPGDIITSELTPDQITRAMQRGDVEDVEAAKPEPLPEPILPMEESKPEERKATKDKTSKHFSDRILKRGK